MSDSGKEGKKQKDDSNKGSDNEEKEQEVKKEGPKKRDKKEEKQIQDLMDRIGKFDTSMESTDKKIIDNAKTRQEEKKKLMCEIDNLTKEIDPFLIKDDEKLNRKVKKEVDNALLVIMDKKYQAEQEVLELKKLLKDRNARIVQLEKENKELRLKNEELEDIAKGGTGRRRRTQEAEMNIPLHSQDAEGFERYQDEPVYDQPPSQDDEDDFWQEGKAAKQNYGNDNDLWIMGKKDTLPPTNMNAYNTPGGLASKAQPPGYGKSLPKRKGGYDPNDDMAFYGVGVKEGGRKV